MDASLVRKGDCHGDWWTGDWACIFPSHQSRVTTKKWHNKNPGQVPLPIPMRAHPEYGAGAVLCT